MPPQHEDTIRTARGLLHAGRLQDADRICSQLLSSTTTAEALALASEVEQAKGNLDAALDLTSRALGHHGETAPLLLQRAQVLMHLGRRAESAAAASRASELAPADAALLTAIAKVLLHCGRAPEAKAVLNRACEVAPRDPATLYETAMVHFYLNEMDVADGLLARVLEVVPGNGFAMLARSQLRRQKPESNHVEELRAALARRSVGEAIAVHFALAKELEDLGEYDQSFDAVRRGNALKRNTLNYDVATDVQALEKVTETYTSETLSRIADGDHAVGPIFIVGMPRSGTTLIERILANHPDVQSVGEVVDFPFEMTRLAHRVHRDNGSMGPDLYGSSTMIDFRELGARYLAAVRQLTDRRWTVDKLPFNFRYCGLIHKALPNARILHLRRDPLDTCYAVFKTLFANAYHFSYQLDELAEYYLAYRRTMDHWHSVLPGVIRDVRYDEVVADAATQIRALLDWCGLPWQETVLEFHRSAAAAMTASAAQIREPIYTSSLQKWRSVAQGMHPVLRRLADAGLVDAAGRELSSPVKSTTTSS